MAATANTVHCPSCSATLRLRDTTRADAVLKCPRCACKFSPNGAVASSADTAPKIPDLNQPTVSLPPGQLATPTGTTPGHQQETRASAKLQETPARDRSSAADDADRSDSERPRSRPRKKHRHDSSMKIKLIIGGIVMLLLVGGAIATTIVLVNQHRKGPVTTVERETSDPDKEKKPLVIAATTPEPEKKQPEVPKQRLLPPLPPGKPVVGTKVGNLVPEIVTEDLNGATFKLSDFRGKVVVLFFWGDWCPYCRKCFPRQKEMVLKFAGRPFSLIGINTDGTKADAKRGLQREQLNWTSWFDGKGGPIVRQWGVSGFPHLVLVDAQGIIRKEYRGYSEESLMKLALEAEELLRDVESEKR
jgi:peroxiredoxin